jgi:hypothetical protein
MASQSPVENNLTIETTAYSKDIEGQVVGSTKGVQIEGARPEMENVIQNPPPTTTQPLQGHKLYAVTVGVCLGALMMSLDISVIATVIFRSILRAQT